MKIAVAEARRIESTAPWIASEVEKMGAGGGGWSPTVDNVVSLLDEDDDEGEVVEDIEDGTSFEELIAGAFRETKTDEVEVTSLLLFSRSSSRGWSLLREAFRRHWTSMTSSASGGRRRFTDDDEEERKDT